MYLVAIVDLYSRYMINWSVSNSMDATWCKQVLEEAIEQHGKPDMINTDQGSQFTAEELTSTVLGNEIKLSMDGKGRAIDNVFIERFYRDIKYEKIHLNPPTYGTDLYLKVAEYMNYYNYQRRHGGINELRPNDLYQPLKQVI